MIVLTFRTQQLTVCKHVHHGSQEWFTQYSFDQRSSTQYVYNAENRTHEHNC
jgi:hypothetical protein